MKREEVLAVYDELVQSAGGCEPQVGCITCEIRAQIRNHIASALDDAVRYRWLKDSLYRQWFEVGEAEIGMRVVGACPTPEQVDTAIDTARAAAAGGEVV